MKRNTSSRPTASEQALLEEVRVILVSDRAEHRRFQRLLHKHHYLGGIKAVGEQLYYAVVDAQGQWVALLLFSAAAQHLKHRDQWIGWTRPQRDRRLPLVVNNSRFLLLPQRTVPNLGSRALRLTLDRLSADWQAQYGHPVLVVETFVDPEEFCGTVYTANNWVELGQTDGWGRHRRDFYVHHDKPKQLFVRELVPNACRSLQAEHLKPDLAAVEQKTTPRCYHKVAQIQAITEHFKAVPEYRQRVECYPLWSLLTLMLLAMLSDAPRGQKDLVKFSRRLTQAQRRAVGIRPNAHRRYPAPCQATFSRLLTHLDGRQVNTVLLEIQAKVRGTPPPEDLIVVDGKEPKHGPGDQILSAVTVPSLFYLGSALVDVKTNEIPVARELFGDLDLAQRRVALDALHTQDLTACEMVLRHGAEYLLTVKNNQRTLRKNIAQAIPVPPTGFAPLEPTPTRARTVERNKGARESRTIQTGAVAAEDIGFPFAAQAAWITRQHTGRKDETVALITSLPPEQLNAEQWLQANRKGWGIENGLHQRLDVSLHDDRCRVRQPNGLWILGMFRRLANSLFMEWLQGQPKPKYKTTTDFQSEMGEDNLAKVMRFVSSKRPKL